MDNNSYEKLTSVEFSYNENKLNVLTTISKMLIERKKVNKSFDYIFNAFKNNLKNNSDNIAIYNDTDNNINYVVKFINRYVQTELNRMIVNTPKLTQHIGDNPESWAVADVVSNAITTELLKNPLFHEINTPIVKLTILERIYDHYAKQYHFPDIRQTNHIITDFTKNLEIEFMVQI